MKNIEDNKFREVFKKAPIAYVLLDYDLKIRAFNKAFLRTLDERGKDILNSSFERYIDVNFISEFLEGIEDLKKSKSLTKVNVFMENNYREFYASLSMDIIILDEVEYITCVILDISKEKQIAEELEYLSFHDKLTGVYNRRFFEEELRRLDVNRNMPITVIMADVDGLKITNDTFGHQAGDQLLVKVSNAFKRASRGDDIIARVGGDEFILLLPNTDEEMGEDIIDRIKAEIGQETIYNLAISVSIGSSTKYRVEEEFANIIKLSENEMYKNKLLESQDVRNKAIEMALISLHLMNSKEADHSRSVGELAKKLAEKLNYRDLTFEEVGKLGLIHDLGKIAIDKKILLKDSPLTIEEREILEKHPEAGYHMLNSVDEMREIAKVVLHHHERWDGKGYPKGLKGEEIPFASRILSVCETYDYLTRDMPNKKAWSKEDTIQEMKKNRGSQFDPYILDVFLEKVIL